MRYLQFIHRGICLRDFSASRTLPCWPSAPGVRCTPSEPRVRIAIAITSLGGGGAERVATRLANSFAERGHEVGIVTLSDVASDRYPLHPEVRRIGLELEGDGGSPPAGLLANLRRVVRLRDAFRSLRAGSTFGMSLRRPCWDTLSMPFGACESAHACGGNLTCQP